MHPCLPAPRPRWHLLCCQRGAWGVCFAVEARGATRRHGGSFFFFSPALVRTDVDGLLRDHGAVGLVDDAIDLLEVVRVGDDLVTGEDILFARRWSAIFTPVMARGHTGLRRGGATSPWRGNEQLVAKGGSRAKEEASCARAGELPRGLANERERHSRCKSSFWRFCDESTKVADAGREMGTWRSKQVKEGGEGDSGRCFLHLVAAGGPARAGGVWKIHCLGLVAGGWADGRRSLGCLGCSGLWLLLQSVVGFTSPSQSRRA